MANETDGKKGEKLARYDLIPPYPLWLLAEVYGRGAAKYADRNWERGVHAHKLWGAMQRHSNQYWAGEDIDPQDKQHHLASVAWMAFALLELQRTHPELDDRPHKMLGQEPQSLSSEVTNPEEIAAAKQEVDMSQMPDILPSEFTQGKVVDFPGFYSREKAPDDPTRNEK
jgi:hypothetical protein